MSEKKVIDSCFLESASLLFFSLWFNQWRWLRWEERSELVRFKSTFLLDVELNFERRKTDNLVFVGLFVGAGSALASAGTVGCWLGYVIMSGIVWTMMTALGEVSFFRKLSIPRCSTSSRRSSQSRMLIDTMNFWRRTDDYDVPC